MFLTDDVRIKSIKPLVSPAILQEELPIDKETASLISHTRQEIAHIIHGRDNRLLVITGPCSIHDPQAALEYAQKLAAISQKLNDDLCIIMRVYFEKPRTTVGWKGLINDPYLDGSFEINKGLRIARKLLLDIAKEKVTAGTEFLDTIIPQFISDAIAWGAIGARTTESQIHRELASGLSMPVGFKNGTTGSVQVAIDALRAAVHPHHFLGLTKHGIPAIVNTLGNYDCHIILRGSQQGPNYHEEYIQAAVQGLNNAHLSPYLMIDCSHGNSEKDHERQAIVAAAICQQMIEGNKAICGVMLESNLVASKQELKPNLSLTYGQSITDACISWEQTETILYDLAKAVQLRRKI